MKVDHETQAALPSAASIMEHSLFHEVWACGRCNRLFEDCTSCVAHEQQCGGQLERW
jgi:hypothetical protein